MRQPGPLQRALKGTLFLTVAVLLLAAIAAVAAYVRLIHGPFSLAALKPSIERHLRAKLGGRDVTVSDVLLSLDSQGLELKLEDVSVHDANRSSVASAPFAAMQIDKMALLRGEISLNGITLIRPRINVSYDEATGLSLSFADAGKAAPNSISAPRPVPATRPEPIPPDTTASRGWQAQVTRRGDDDPGTTPAEPTGGLPQAAMVHRPEPAPPASSKNVFELLAGFMGDVAAHKDRTGGLDRMGVRNAIIVFEHAGRRSVWGVPSGDIEIKRSGPAVLLTGLTTIADAAGNNASFAFSAETAPGRRPIALTGSIRELRPEAMAELMGGIVDVGALDAPISAEGQFNLTPAGVVVDGSVAVELGRGQVDLPPQTEMAPVRIDHGRIALKVHKDHPGALIEPSTLAWGGGNEVRFRGRVAPISEGTSVWSFSLDGLGGRLLPASGKAKDTARAIDALSARGRLDASRGSVVLDSGTVNVGGLSALFELSYAAANKRAGARPDVRLAARISPGPLDGLLYLWPVNLGVDARAWMRTHLAGGRLTEGRIDYRWPPLGAESEAAGDGKGPVSIALSGEGVALAGVTPSGLVVAPKALLRLSGRSLELAMPDAELSLTGTKPLTLSQLSFEIDDIWRPDIAGKIAATMEGPLRTAARLAMTNAAVSPAMADRLERVAAKASGKLAGKLEIVVPLDGRTAKARPTGEIRIIGASLEDVAPGHDMSGGRFDIALTEKVVTARGAVQIDGVPAKLDWSHIYDADRARQLPIRLRANLDAADREKLGIRINHILRGTLQTEVLLAERENGTFHTEARIDAREAQISIESLAWVKPKGRDTQIDFEIVPSADEGVALEKLRIVGDGIAIQGRAALDRNFALRAFEFPSFSIDRVTRLSITGRLAKNNNWRVDVKGQTYEGSSLFRSLFNAGHVKGGLHVEDPNQPGVDLEAEIKTVLGFWSTRLADVRMTLSKRAGRLQSLQLDGRLVAGGELKAAIVTTTRGRRELHAFSSNAGEAFRLVGFYPNARRGRLELVVDLDGRGAAEKSGVLLVRNFDIVGDEVVREMAAAPRGGVRRRPSQRAGADGVQALSFDWMRLPFLVGNGQFILRSAELRGPVVGATLQGKADFDARRVDVSGTYVPLQGLNGALGVIPGLGQILAGPKGEGVLGMKFAVRGPMGQPDVLVNPLSLMAPGIFREIFQISNPSLEVTERSPRRAPGVTPRPRTDENRRGWANRAFGDGN
jgi:hypothetical protein